MLTFRPLLILATVVALAACGGGEDTPEPAADTDVGGMAGMGSMGMDGEMMQRMQTHMQTMDGTSGEAMMQMMPQHRPMVANMIAQMSREMREMNMPADEEWGSTIEGLRQDLVRMPEMTPAEMEAFMPEHRARVLRLMEMHQEMMALPSS